MEGRVGNITRDPELRYSAKGVAFATFGLAVTPWAPKGEPKPDTEFYDVTCFASLAEAVAECMVKGDRVAVVGNAQDETWAGRDGVSRTTHKIVADAVGPDLRFVTATINRTQRVRPQPAPNPEYDDEPF